MRVFPGKKQLYIIAVIIFSVTMLWGLCVRKFENSFFVIIENEVKQLSNSAINESFKKISGKIDYEKIINITKNADGRIIAVSANGINISNFKNILTDTLQKNISDEFPRYISIPLGKLMPYPLVHSMGPAIKFKVSPQSVVKTRLSDEFESTGINQVRHVIYLDITTEFTVMSNVHKKTYTYKDRLLLTDTVLLGDVPKSYGGNGILNGIN